MREALREADKAEKAGEVPVGAVVVYGGTIIGRGHNRTITLNDPTAHAEIIALRKAAGKLKSYRLNTCVLYVTIEPCAMCAGAAVWSRVERIVFGAAEPKSGACGSILNVAHNKKLNHRIKVTRRVLEQECREIVQDFFKRKR